MRPATINRMWALGAVALAAIGALLLLIWAGQRHLIYFPSRGVPPPAAVGLAGAERVMMPLEDGGTLNGWFVPGSRQPAAFTVLVFNGNAGNRAYRAPLASAFHRRGVAVLLFDYRGFGDNTGAPTQHGLEADARAAHTYLLSRQDVCRDRIVFFGESLGSAVAISLALDRAPAALVLRSPFTSMADVGRFHYPVLPVRWLLRDRYASIDVIGRLRSPLLVIAGDRDSVVPLEQSQRLFAAATGQKEMVVIPGADHNDRVLLDGEQMVASTLDFLQRTVPAAPAAGNCPR